jgi:glycosyltransferase involved in cell wall biosynthesis
MIKKYYLRDSVVIHPPVDIDRFFVKPKDQRVGFVTSGRQTPYKKTELIVNVCNLLNLPLLVLGDGPEHKNLVKIAGKAVRFVRKATDKDIENGLAGAKGFIFAASEDFGITPIEAFASGTPVIAYKAGGALDYVNDKTGVFFEHQTIDSLGQTLQDFDPSKFNQKDLTTQAQNFNKSIFVNKITKLIHSYIVE